MANSGKKKKKAGAPRAAGNEKGSRGCCTITFNGSTTTYSDKTEKQCEALARNFPGATYTHTPGKKCP